MIEKNKLKKMLIYDTYAVGGNIKRIRHDWIFQIDYLILSEL